MNALSVILINTWQSQAHCTAGHLGDIWRVLANLTLKRHECRAPFLRSLPVFCLCVLLANSVQASESIAILPGDFTLSGSAARQRLLMERFKDNHFAGQITNGIAFSSGDTNILRIDNDLALPLKMARSRSVPPSANKKPRQK